jgi:FixJ family two-component response regulator
MKNDSTVFIVDDDPGVRRALRMLMKSVGLNCETFESARDFLDGFDSTRPGCLVLDIRMPGMSGLELQEKLAELGKQTPPVVFMTAHGDVPMAVGAMKAGAVDFIQKPFRDQEMIDRIQKALDLDRSLRSENVGKEAVLERIERLTPREKEVLDLIVDGKPNKGIAFELGVSERTVEIHRSRVMRKMEAESLAELVQMVLRIR